MAILFAQHAAELSCRSDGKTAVRPSLRSFEEAEKRSSPRQDRETAQDQRHTFGRFVPPRAWPSSLGQMRNVAQRTRIARSAPKNPRTARGILARCARSRDEEDYNQSLERAGRVADFLEFAELMCLDALERDESAGAHFREEHQTSDGEALRETTRAMQLCSRGNFKVKVSLRNCTANSCISKRCIWRKGATNDCIFRHSERSRGIPVRNLGVFPRDPSTPLRSAQDDREPMNFKLKIWRQKNRQARGKSVDYEVRDISPDTSFSRNARYS